MGTSSPTEEPLATGPRQPRQNLPDDAVEADGGESPRARASAERHGGAVRVDAGPGEGATLSVALPAGERDV